MQPSKKRIATNDTKNATIIPTIKATSSGELIEPTLIRNFTSFRKLAPNITGIDKKKENSVAICLEAPRVIPPSIVAPDLEVPGIKDNT